MGDPIIKREEDSVKELGRVLKQVFKDIPLYKKMPENFWKTNSYPFLDKDKIDYDLLDGFVNWNSFEDSLDLFFTTDNLIYHYFKKDGIVSLNSLTTLQLENIIQQTFYIDSKFTNFYSYKLPSEPSLNAYLIIGLSAQDYPFAPPDEMYILINKDGVTYIKSIFREREEKKYLIPAIPICERLKDSAYKFQSDMHSTIEEEDKKINPIVKMYCNCYSENLKHTPQYPALEKLIEDSYLKLQNMIK
jgi:hypothetical protein